MLHAHVLGFKHPGTGRTVKFTAPVPGDMVGVINALRDNEQRTKDKGQRTTDVHRPLITED
jgi:hypothetical protein